MKNNSVMGIGHGAAWGAGNTYHPNTRSFYPPGHGPISVQAPNPTSSTRQTTTSNRPTLSENCAVSGSLPTGSHSYNLPKIVIHPSSPTPNGGRSQPQSLHPLQTRTAEKCTYTSTEMLSPQHAGRKNVSVQTSKPGQISYNTGSSETGNGTSR